MLKKESSGGPSQTDCSGKFLNYVVLYKIICLEDWKLKGNFYPLLIVYPTSFNYRVYQKNGNT